MVAVLLAGLGSRECCQLGAAHQDVRLGGAGIKVDELTTVEVSKMLAVWRPGKALRRSAHKRPMRVDSFHSERLYGGLCSEGCERQGNNGKKQQGGYAHQGNSSWAEPAVFSLCMPAPIVQARSVNHTVCAEVTASESGKLLFALAG